ATTSAATAPPTRAGGADGTGVPGGCVVGPGTMGRAVGACREGAGREDGAGAAVPSVNSCSRSQKARGLLLPPITWCFLPPCRTVSHTHSLTEDATRAGAVCSREAKTRRQAHHCWTPTIPSIQLPAWVSMTRLRINITKTITPAAPKQYQE